MSMPTLNHSFSFNCVPATLCSQVGLLQAEEQAGFVRYMCMEMAEDIGAGEGAGAGTGEVQAVGRQNAHAVAAHEQVPGQGRYRWGKVRCRRCGRPEALFCAAMNAPDSLSTPPRFPCPPLPAALPKGTNGQPRRTPTCRIKPGVCYESMALEVRWGGACRSEGKAVRGAWGQHLRSEPLFGLLWKLQVQYH